MPQVSGRNLRRVDRVEEVMRSSIARLAVMASLMASLAACTVAPGPTPVSTASPATSAVPSAAPPSNSPIPNPSGTPFVVTDVSSPAQAAAVVFASNPMFTSVSQPLPSVIGQSSSYRAAQVGDGFSVAVTLGSGDCLAGCINSHTWTYTVSRTGTVKVVSEQGDPVEAPIDAGASAPATITVHLAAGPVCPVQRDSPDPNCAPRPVVATEVVLRDPSGAEIGRATSDDQGTATFSVPGGAYYVEPASVPGYMGTAMAQAVSVPGGRSVAIQLDYDTGIR